MKSIRVIISCIAMIASISIASGKGRNKVSGYIRDTEGKPVAGVAVSDGFNVTSTDKKGRYTINDVAADCFYIYYSTPSGYEVTINEHGQPQFWKEYIPGVKSYDFTLKSLPQDKEKEFALFAFGDPQVHSKGNLERFLKEAVPGIKTHANSLDIPMYGMTLGDVIFNTDNFKCTHMMDDMRDGFSVQSVGMPVYQISGNHDHNEFNAQNPLVADSRSSDTNIKALRDFETVFGPVDYSFNRSDAHIIGMRNVIFLSATTSSTGNYHGGFTDRQYEWLKQDLALVPKDKLIIFCVHIPLYRCEDKSIPSLNTDTNVSKVMDLLSQYENVHILSGHTHTQRNHQHSNGIWEHTIASVAGAWWRCNVCGDGTPNGFCVFNISGNQITDFYFHGYTAASSSRKHQMRLYRGNAVTGAAISGENKHGTAGYYGFNMSDDVILANVYNASSEWKISVYEDGIYSGDMTLLPSEQPDIKDLTGSYTYDDPRRADDRVETGHDFWVTGYLMGVQGKKKTNGGYQNCFHMYQYKLKNKDAAIKVIATDPWGNTYEETIITEGTDYSTAVKPVAGKLEVYSPSMTTRRYYPIVTRYLKTWSKSPAWVEVKARTVPYLNSFENYNISREEYLESTNMYGSSTTLPRQEATGRFYVTKVDGRFWLVDPDGYLHHHRGVASLRPSKDETGADNSAFLQKYGNRSEWICEVQEELASVGFHGIGAFSTVHRNIFEHNTSNPDKPLTLCPSFHFLREFKKRHDDLMYCNGDINTAICLVLDERWDAFCDEFISAGPVRNFLNNPDVIGIFSDNEIEFSSLKHMLLEQVLETENHGHPAYEAARKFMEEKGTEEVTEALNDEWAGLLAEKYYKGVKEALKKHDPQMLYLGSRLHGTPKIMESVVRAAGRWCDVISINYYGCWSVEAVEHVQKWAEWAPETPFMVTEFYTKGNDSELPNIAGAGFLVPTQKDRALAYQHFTLGLLEAKNCVGWHWFKYQDDAPSEYGEKASNKGLYDKDYNMYPWLEEYTRMLNFNTYRLIEYFDK